MSDISVTSAYDDTMDFSAFRYGQVFTYENLREVADRDPYARFLVREIVEEALGAGFDLIDPETEEKLEQSDAVWQALEAHWPEYIKANELERTYGRSVLAVFFSDNPNTRSQPFITAFEPKEIDTSKMEYYNDRSLKTIGLKMRTVMNDSALSEEIQEIGGKDIENVLLCRSGTKKDWWKGRSYLEPIWDELFGLRLLRCGATLLGIRVGAGLKIIIEPLNLPPLIRDQLRSGAKKMDSIDGAFFVPEGVDVKLQSTTGTFDYEKLRSILQEAISAYSKIPMARFRGIEPGQLEAGKVNESSYFDVLRKIQRPNVARTKWLISRFDIFHKFNLPDNFDISWRVRPELTEEEQVSIDFIRTQRLTLLVQNNIITREAAAREEGFQPSDIPDEDFMTLGQENDDERRESGFERSGDDNDSGDDTESDTTEKQ